MAIMTTVNRLMHDFSEERATNLAKEAVAFRDRGDLESASRKLREAAALGHDNAEVQSAFIKLHDGQTQSPLLGLCRRYALYNDSKAGDDAANYLSDEDRMISGGDAVDCLKLILTSDYSKLSPVQDKLIARLARRSRDVRQYFASELQTSTTEFFDNVYVRGNESANYLRTVVLDQGLWSSEADRLQVEDDLFQLLLAKLMESGHDLDGRALKGLALLLMADTKRLSAFIDQPGFDAILSSLDIRCTPDVRTQATVAASKYLEVSELDGQKYFVDFVTSRVGQQKAEPIVAAFSAAAALFPIATSMTATLFLTEGFLPSLMPLLDRKLKDDRLYDTFLHLLNAACVDGACRKVIGKYCSDWLSHIVSNGSDDQTATAATVLAKLRTSKSADDGDIHHNTIDVDELVAMFKSTLASGSSKISGDSIEGLAYASLKPHVKEELAKDTKFLLSLHNALDRSTQRPEVIIGGLSIISNLSQYPPILSEEQKKMSELKAYANAQKKPQPNVLESDNHVTNRCQAVIKAGFVPVMVRMNKNSSKSAQDLMDKILLSLSRDQKTRGTLAQQGAVKLLLSHRAQAQPSESSAHALARILISVDPSHVFPASGTPHITTAVGPLVKLLGASNDTPAATFTSDGPRDLLPLFEALLALTNLASSPDPSASSLIIRTAWNAIEDLLLNNNTMIRRAACELVCNLVPADAGAAKYLDGSKRAAQRLHILLALADVDDVATRRAAGGALAMLTEVASAVSAILDVKRGPEIVLGLCSEDEPEDIVHRGLVVVRNLSCASDPAGPSARKALTDLGAVDILKSCVRRTKNPALLQVGVEALKPLIE